ncbi:MAG: metallophosphoesterase [Methylomicrobium sp.]|nr:metallophosphoesterase [Methylomicrobium sp.]
MNILHISDTHGEHETLDLANLQADVLVHSGDFTFNGSQKEVIHFFDWFSRQPFEHKILVPGNHDYFVEKMFYDPELKKYFWPKSFHLLVSEGIEIDGVKFWGSPVTPWFFDGAFNRKKDKIAGEWAKIPTDTQVLITHGPRYGVLDRARGLSSEGCFALQVFVQDTLPNLRLHLHGHIHDEHGQHRAGKLLTLNSAIMDEDYCPNNLPQLAQKQGEYFVSPSEQMLSHYLEGQAWSFALEHGLVSKGLLSLLSQIRCLDCHLSTSVDAELLLIHVTLGDVESDKQQRMIEALNVLLKSNQYRSLLESFIVVTHDGYENG